MSATLLHLKLGPYLQQQERPMLSLKENVELDFLAMAMESDVAVTVQASESLLLALEKLELHLSLDDQGLRPH